MPAPADAGGAAQLELIKCSRSHRFRGLATKRLCRRPSSDRIGRPRVGSSGIAAGDGFRYTRRLGAAFDLDRDLPGHLLTVVVNRV